MNNFLTQTLQGSCVDLQTNLWVRTTDSRGVTHFWVSMTWNLCQKDTEIDKCRNIRVQNMRQNDTEMDQNDALSKVKSVLKYHINGSNRRSIRVKICVKIAEKVIKMTLYPGSNLRQNCKEVDQNDVVSGFESDAKYRMA